MKLFKLSLIIQIIKSPQIPKLNYDNLEKLKKYNERFLTFRNWDALMMLVLEIFSLGIFITPKEVDSELTNLV